MNSKIKYFSLAVALVGIFSATPAKASWHPLDAFSDFDSCTRFVNQWTFDHHFNNPSIINGICIFQAAARNWLAFYETVN